MTSAGASPHDRTSGKQGMVDAAGSSVAAVGVGILGGAIAGRFLERGHAVTLYDLDPAATRILAAELRGACGMAWVDALLSGGTPVAAAGRLTVARPR